MKRIRILPLPPGIPEPPPLKAIRELIGLPEVHIEVPNEITLKPGEVNIEVGASPKIVFKLEREEK